MPFPSDAFPPLVSRFDFRNPSLWWARARLVADHLELTGWTWRGRYRRRIALSRILHVDVRGEDELVLWLLEGEVLRLRVEQAQQWKAGIEVRRGTPGRPSCIGGTQLPIWLGHGQRE